VPFLSSLSLVTLQGAARAAQAGHLIAVNVEWEDSECDDSSGRLFASAAVEREEFAHEFQASQPLPFNAHRYRDLWRDRIAPRWSAMTTCRVNPARLSRAWTLSCA
jgi:hypothetical protein